MDFFARQDAARRRTSLLVFHFATAVVLIIVGVYLVLLVVAYRFGGVDGLHGAALWNPGLFAASAIGVLAVVGIGSLYKISALRQGGGTAVAASLGGRLIPTDTRDFAERRTLNVVEEMALASGVPCPPVYILPDETAINAFAAGYTPDDAVIGVTRGAVVGLTRDELQGVIAHEFSHVLNGDMRLNIRLIGVLHGILVLAIIGRIALRATGTGRSRSRDDGKAQFAILAIGLALLVLGSIGVFFGKLIKAAVSRQREFLADASAVQFTRNPPGIAGALEKIGGLMQGSRLNTPKAEQASHMYFANGLKGSWAALFSTHPDLTERIRRIDPSFDGEFEAVTLEELARSSLVADAAPAREVPEAARELERLQAVVVGAVVTDPERILDTVGAPMRAHVEWIRARLRELPSELLEAAREPFGARALVYAMLIDRTDAVRAKQLEILGRDADPAVFETTRKLLPAVDELEPQLRMPLVDLSISALRTLAEAQYRTFRSNVERLTEADDTLELFEYALRTLLVRQLDGMFGPPKRGLVRFHDVGSVLPQCAMVLSLLARIGHDDPSHAAEAFAAGSKRLGAASPKLRFLPEDECTLERVDRALADLFASTAAVKRRLLAACLVTLGHDKEVRLEEFELFRAVAESLECPVPPWLGTGT